MTIRYTCKECKSVLKIRTELAGTTANCPKCKTEFVIPKPELLPAGLAAASDEPLPLDMPLEVTPEVDLRDTDLVESPDLASGATPGVVAKIAAPPDSSPKPSVAELMREHEATRKKKTEKKQKGSLEAAAAVAGIVTSGSASDVLTRTYDQKRGKSSDPPPMTREERREAEQREAIKQFAIRGGAGLAGVLVFAYFLVSWAFSDAIPDLEYSSGVVMLNNAPLAGVRVEFAPVKTLGGPNPENATPSVGYTNEAGEYVLMYDPVNEGVLAGIHSVSIMMPSGAMFQLSAADREKTVSESGENTFNFSLSTGG